MSKKIKFKHFKVLEVTQNYLIGARGYSLYKYIFTTKRYALESRVNDKYALFSRCFLTRRLLRAEINNLYTLPNGDQLIIAKKGIFRKSVHDKVFEKCFAIRRGSKTLNLCIIPSGDIYWGEYFQNIEKKAVHIYHSADGGSSWSIVYTFPEGEINHVHGLFWDKYTESIWVATGDRENECIISNTLDGFNTLNIVFRGGQEYRTTVLLFYKDAIIFGTDSQYIQNEIKRIDRKTLKITSLQQIQGSAIKGGQYDDFAFLSTTIEPSKVNKDKSSYLWITRNGVDWREVYSDQKDFFPPMFQYGSIEFPRYMCSITDRLMFSGRALRQSGGHSMMISI